MSKSNMFSYCETKTTTKLRGPLNSQSRQSLVGKPMICGFGECLKHPATRLEPGNEVNLRLGRFYS